VVGWLLIPRSLPKLPALDTSVLMLGQPMLAVFWALLFYDEALGVSQWIGVALVLGGLLFFGLRRDDDRSTETGQQVIEPSREPS